MPGASARLNGTQDVVDLARGQDAGEPDLQLLQRRGAYAGAIFAQQKLPLQVCLGALAIDTNAVKGLSARLLSQDVKEQNESAFVPMGLRPGLASVG